MDLYHEIYSGEIFQKSQCIWHENTILDFLRSTLRNLGYSSQDSSNKVWARGNRTVVVCLVDDFSTCSTAYSTPLPYLFDRNTVVITDNRINVPTQYQVCQLPVSFYGIYSHEPEHDQWQPNRRLNFAVNRLDSKRLLMFLEHQLRTEYQPPDIDYVNFNCWAWDGNNSNAEGSQDNFNRYYANLEEQYHAVYDTTYQRIKDQQPYRNHDLSQEQVHVSAWMNMVMETYSSDNNIALSEKAFRAMCLPAPWMLYSGRHTVAYLNSLRFDTLQDITTHKYDSMIENKTAAYGDKMVDFLFEAAENVEKLQTMDRNELDTRLQQAAKNNQEMLSWMRRSWPREFAAWWPEVVEIIR